MFHRDSFRLSVPFDGLSRREFLAASAATALLPGLPKGERVNIDAIPPYRVVEPLFEGVRLILNHRGENFSPAYFHGIAGTAFRIAGICPCAPTCSSHYWTTDLVHRFGYETSALPLSMEKADEAKEKLPGMIEAVKRSIRSGEPVLVWHAFTNAEWDVVTGFDDVTGVFIGRGSYFDQKPARAKQTRPAEALSICPAYGALLIGQKTGRLNTMITEREALVEAVRHARTTTKLENGKWTLLNGIEAYDRWASDWRKADTKRSNGDSYCAGIYSSTHSLAAPFLREVAPNHPSMAANLMKAADSFELEAKSLRQAQKLLGWETPEMDAARNEKVAPLLRQSRDHYAEAIDNIAAALKG